MKLRAIHLFLILLASLILCSCLGQFTVEGMSGSRRDSGSVKDSVKDSIGDTVKATIKDSIKGSISSSGVSGLVSGINRSPPQANINGDAYSSDSDLSDNESSPSSISYPSSYPSAPPAGPPPGPPPGPPAGPPPGPPAAPAYPQPSAQPTYPPAPTDYSQPSSASLGIPRSQIAPGSEDLYILKSEVIPPVCPACPTMSACPRQEPCTPCPPCARCPEPSFECKKVPNYSTNDDSYLPRPVLADFSQFGA